MVCLRIAEYLADTIDCTIRSPHRNLCNAVSIEIEHDELVIVWPRSHILARRNAPKALLRRHVVSVVEDRSGAPEMRVVFAKCVPLDHKFHLAVTIQISDRTVVGAIGIRIVLRFVGILPRWRRLDLERDISNRRIRRNAPSARSFFRFASSQNGLDGIHRPLRWIKRLVPEECRSRKRTLIKPRRAAINIESKIRRILHPIPPRDNRLSLAASKGDNTAPKLLLL